MLISCLACLTIEYTRNINVNHKVTLKLEVDKMIKNFLFGAMMVWTGYNASIPGGSTSFEELL